MKKLLNLILVMAVVALVCSSCKTTQLSNDAAYVSFETQCLGVELDGSQTLRAWGKGKDRADALEQAKKNAVRDVIFKGIRAGVNECNTKPLIFEVNAEEKYQYYFNKFFADGGEYKKYVSDADENLTSRMKAVSSTQQNWSVVVRVLRTDLRERLIQDNIIKP
ncbi:MAG: hypothetical protein IJ442_06380 [Bacteroidaceae bacterium]|nr:hypothetical protein [Bacteroidaceae bacterium]